MKRRKLSAIISSHSLKGLLAILVVLYASVSQAKEWTRFRGPNGQGISNSDKIPTKWTEKDYNWKVKLPGGGHSSPVVWNKKIFVTGGDEKADSGTILTLSTSDARILWQKEYVLGSYRKNSLNSYAAPTPAVDADHVYSLWPASDKTLLVAHNHTGSEIWKRTFDGVHSRHGAGCSPIVFEDIVVFAHEQEGGGDDVLSTWIAVDCKTGKTRWRLERTKSAKMSYSTPCIYGEDKPQLVFASHAHGITGVDPHTGKVMWEAGSAFADRVVSSPVIADGLIIGTCGTGSSGKRLIAIRPGGANTEPKEVYRIENSTVPYVPVSLALGELLFTFHDRGDISCLRSATGEKLWRQKPAGRFYGSPVCVDGKLYCITTAGEVVVLRGASTYELLAINPLGEKSHATPAVADGRMYLRTLTHLISIGSKKQ
jgi:outer membrane protein assembly factor BamB